MALAALPLGDQFLLDAGLLDFESTGLEADHRRVAMLHKLPAGS